MSEHTAFSGSVPVGVAVALLVSLRELDTPADPEVLGESDLPLNLRRRLGLSTVVIDQIRRYEQHKRNVSATEVASLFELISRRVDARRIFEDAGKRIALEDYSGRRLLSKLGVRITPQRLRSYLAWNRVRRITRRISPGATIRVERKVHTLTVQHSLSATAAEGGTGCSVINGMIRQVFTDYRAGDSKVKHTTCEARLGDYCQWSLESVGPSKNKSPDSTTHHEQAGNGATSDEKSATTTSPIHSDSVAID